MSAPFDDVLRRLKVLEEGVNALLKASARSGIERRDDARLDRRADAAGRFTVVVPIVDGLGAAPAAHASSHLAAGSDPLYTAQAWTPSNDSTLRTVNVTTLTATDANVQLVANLVVTLIRDEAAGKRPTV